ncbi:MAG: bile acid:sodium symporter [Planctomycetales bacterium]|nr:bile acid:sodium symporter [Planctomycetales bacterium]
MKQFFIRRWFLICLAVVLVAGMTLYEPLAPLASNRRLRESLVAAVLFVMALPLEASAMWRSLRRPWAPMLAVTVNYGLLPALTWLVALFVSDGVAAGLYIAAATPCTLASASVWTRRAGGNDAAAILVTILTNVSCFVVTPLWLLALTGKQVSSETLDVRAMIVKLLWLVVLPMAAAQLLRVAAPVRRWATARKTPLGVSAQCGVLTMVLFGAIQSGQRLFGADSASIPVRELAEMVVAVAVIHTTMFWVGFGLAKMLWLRREDQIAVAFAGSQKTLMVGLQVGMELGFTILPMVTYHVFQLLIDTIFADRLRSKGDAENL